MEAILPLIIQLVSGAAGGNIIGQVAKGVSLGPVGNSAIGAIGGLVGSWLINSFVGPGAADPTAVAAIIQSLLGGGVSGGVVTAIVGVVKGLLAGGNK